MTITISASVGELGVNRHIDVVAVQLLLNRAGGSPKPLLPDGISGPLTKAAIRAFQVRSLDPRLADGRVDPGGPTLRA
jgi:peptidoglycan hydrolase-like protein with peptidoglycan-binding domain